MGVFDSLPGYRLVSKKPVGLPVYKITSLAIIAVKNPLHPVEEFTLKSINVGLHEEINISDFLGIDVKFVREALVNLRMGNLIDLSPLPDSKNQTWLLTNSGKRALNELIASLEPPPVRVGSGGSGSAREEALTCGKKG